MMKSATRPGNRFGSHRSTGTLLELGSGRPTAKGRIKDLPFSQAGGSLRHHCATQFSLRKVGST